MSKRTARTEQLIGRTGMHTLERASVAVFGLGGVGSYTVEALARSGIGTIVVVDADSYEETNINRQLYAADSTLGYSKVEIAKQRVADINPDIYVETHALFYTAQNADAIALDGLDYIIDAIDTVSSKLTLIERAHMAGVPIISSMGTGNKIYPARFEVADIYSTSVCPLAKVMRKELRELGIEKLKVVYSKEEPMKPVMPVGRNTPPGSFAFVPPVAGMILAGEVVRELLGYV